MFIFGQFIHTRQVKIQMFVHIVNHHFRARIFFYEIIHTLYVIIEISKVLLTFFWENWQAFGKFLTLPNAAGKFQQNTLCFSSSLIVRFPSFCWRRKRFSTAFAVFIVVVVFGGRKFFCSVFFVGLLYSGFESFRSSFIWRGFWSFWFLSCRFVCDKGRCGGLSCFALKRAENLIGISVGH